MQKKNEMQLETLLLESIQKPGLLLEAYRAFHNFSIQNQFWAHWQCRSRGVKVGPLATFKQWKAKGRSVKKGEKAIELCMPRTFDKKDKDTGEKTGKKGMYFIFVKRWFTVSQTDGETVSPVDLPEWNIDKALDTLGIKLEEYDSANGNAQGYAYENKIAVNPLAQLPNKTLFHEVAHFVLKHTANNNYTATAVKEVEAESVAMCLLELNQLDGAEYCRGYIQSWIEKGGSIPADSAKKIMSAVNKIMDAGKTEKEKSYDATNKSNLKQTA